MDCALRGTRYIAVEHIGTIGEVAVITDHRGVRRKMSLQSLVCRAVSTDGRRLGAITGADIDEVSLMVCALELSRGFWDDIYNGRSTVSGFNIAGAASDTVIVDLDKQDNEEDES